MNTLEASANAALASAEQLYTELLDTVEARIARLPDTASVADVERITSEAQPRLDSLEADVSNAKRQLESAARITRAREASAHLIPHGDQIAVRETASYDPRDTSRSWFADLYSARHRGDHNALDRLQRSNQEFDATIEKRGLSFQDREQRTAFASTDFYPPIWMADLWTSTKRQRRVAAQLCQNLPLPPSGNTIEVPGYTAPRTGPVWAHRQVPSGHGWIEGR
jgi:hypothetical protein